MPKSFFGNSFGVADHPVESTFKIKKTIIENDVSEFRV